MRSDALTRSTRRTSVPAGRPGRNILAKWSNSATAPYRVVTRGKAFVWSTTVDTILDKVRRCKVILGTHQ